MTAEKLISKPNDVNNVLIISQDVDMVRTWKMLFEQRKCHVITEATAHEGLLTSRLLSPTLIILDMDLPHEEMLDLCRKLRATTNGTLLLLNANQRSVRALDYHKVGVDETINANISPMALLVKSLAWLARQDWIVPRRQSTDMWA